MKGRLDQRSRNSFVLHQSYWLVNCLVSKPGSLVGIYLCLGSYVPKQGVGERHIWVEVEAVIVYYDGKALQCISGPELKAVNAQGPLFSADWDLYRAFVYSTVVL